MIAEVIIAACHPPYDSFWEQWGSSLANGLIAIGVATEIKLGQMAGLRQSELRRRSDEKVATALERAAKAETDLIEFRTPRRAKLRPHTDRIAQQLKAFPHTKFDMGFGGGDGEQADLCWDIEEMLANAGWDQQQWGVISVGGIPAINDRGTSRPRAGNVSAANVEIHLEPDTRAALLPAAMAFGHELNVLGIHTKIVRNNTRNANIQAMHILIGPKA